MLGLDSSHSKLELRVLDWNRFASNKSLGSVVVDVSKLRIGTFYDEWRPMDTQGELHVLIHLSRLHTPSPQALNLKLPKCRIHLEQSEYYPGQTLRGCFVMSTSKKFKMSYIMLTIEGASSTYWLNHIGRALVLASNGLLVGDLNPGWQSKVHSIGEGLHLMPFECALPLTLPHTYNSGAPPHVNTIGTNVNLYRVIANIGVPGEINRVHYAPFRVLAHPMHAVLDPNVFTVTPSTKDAPVHVNIEGPSVAWTGEQYSLNVTIRNNSGTAIDHVLIRLKMINFISGKHRMIKWKLHAEEAVLVHEWNIAPNSGTPIAPGQTWTHTVALNIPSGLNPSMLSTISPLLQNGYTLGIKACASAKSFLKTTGNKKMAIAVSDHYTAFEQLEAPVEPVGAVGKLIVAPAPPDMASKIVPAPLSPNPLLNLDYFGGCFGSIAALPGAGVATPIPPKYAPGQIYGTPTPIEFYPTTAEWTSGAPPVWMGPGKAKLDEKKAKKKSKK